MRPVHAEKIKLILTNTEGHQVVLFKFINYLQ